MITVDRCVNLISTPNLSSKIVEVFTRISKATEAFISIYFSFLHLEAAFEVVFQLMLYHN